LCGNENLGLQERRTAGAHVAGGTRATDLRRRERLEKITLKIVGVTFFALAAYVAFDALHALIRREPPSPSYVGIALAVLSLIVMPLLARAKRKIAARINRRALQADSRQTGICAYLSAILVGGLVWNAALGWVVWADPVAALAMAPIISMEGIEAFRGETCCDGCH
jgi:divalent metal cation (Fe/Co/Zn/Cd) transporter